MSPEDELKGMDLLKHGESAYPAAVSYQTGLGRIPVCNAGNHGADHVPAHMGYNGPLEPQ